MTTNLPSRFFSTTGFVVLAALTLTACGSAAEDGEPDGSRAPADTTAESPEGFVPDAGPGLAEPPTGDTGEGAGEDASENPFAVWERAEGPVTGMAFDVQPATTVSLAGSPLVTVHWAGTTSTTTVAGEDCQGMLTVTDPLGQLITFEPELPGCLGSTDLWLNEEAGATTGDYLVTVVVDDVEGQAVITAEP